MHTGFPILDAIESAKARDEGIEQSTENNSEWISLAFLELEQIAKGIDGWSNLEHGFSGEDIRNILTPRIGQPSSPHAWGTLIMHAVRRKIITATGRYVPMRDVKSHARKTPVYCFVRVT
jgi:hypothetical protein